MQDLPEQSIWTPRLCRFCSTPSLSTIWVALIRPYSKSLPSTPNRVADCGTSFPTIAMGWGGADYCGSTWYFYTAAVARKPMSKRGQDSCTLNSSVEDGISADGKLHLVKFPFPLNYLMLLSPALLFT